MMSKASTNVCQEDREICTKVTGRVVLNEVEDYLRWNNMIQKNVQFFATVVESISLVSSCFFLASKSCEKAPNRRRRKESDGNGGSVETLEVNGTMKCSCCYFPSLSLF